MNNSKKNIKLPPKVIAICYSDVCGNLNYTFERDTICFPATKQ